MNGIQSGIYAINKLNFLNEITWPMAVVGMEGAVAVAGAGGRISLGEAPFDDEATISHL